MKRIPFVILVWALLLGGMTFYMRHRDGRRRAMAAPTARTADRAEGTFSVEVTPTFPVEADPFALRTDADRGDAGLVVLLNGRDLLRRSDGGEPGEVIRLDGVAGFAVGANEVRVEAYPPEEPGDRRHFVQVRVLRNGAPLADDTFWSEGGAAVTGSLGVEVPSGAEDSHDD